MYQTRSPWSALNDIKKVSIEPLKTSIDASLAVAGSKSYTNRAVIIAGVAKGCSNVRNILQSDDSYWCVSALKQLGVKIQEEDNNLKISGVDQWQQPQKPVYVGSGGTTARFLTSVLALTVPFPIAVHASAQMSTRPMQTLFNKLIELGADINYPDKPGYFPIELAPMKSGKRVIEISGAKSSQFLSGLLIATPLLKHEIEINVVDGIVQSDYITVTLATMAAFGVELEYKQDYSNFKISPQPYQANDFEIEADASTASYFLAIAAVTGGKITLSNLNAHTHQPDIKFLNVLEKLGCQVNINNNSASVVGPQQLKGGFSVDMNDCSDTTLTLAAIAPFADGAIEITGVEHIRSHESDRIKVMADSLKKLNVPVEERKDGLLISPANPSKAHLETHDDHRVAMALSVLGLAGAGIELDDPGCVSKTCPLFFQELEKLGVKVNYASN